MVRARALHSLALVVALTGCASPGTAPQGERAKGFRLQSLAKSDIDQVAELHHRAVFDSLRRLALKLYLRNPGQWRKAGHADAAAAVGKLFDQDHRWRLESLNYRRGAEAVQIALNPAYPGDRVEAFIVGLAGMVQQATGDRTEFFLLDDLDPQRLYNAARNFEIAAWKLANARDASGELLLLSNEVGPVTNLSFEREFGRMIGSLDVLAEILAEREGRTITRVIQSAASAVFLPL
ncbi:hypothetical protein [Nitrogeniibacter aestuarii]|uniref:hypothetical protein n=1 Tax=Nitrogeniibacter aestuarii TaxID=2815343 RepID=UPI001D0F7EED|nr:hypothetical protein [Nitrogeniibacter aestuarii]